MWCMSKEYSKNIDLNHSTYGKDSFFKRIVYVFLWILTSIFICMHILLHFQFTCCESRNCQNQCCMNKMVL